MTRRPFRPRKADPSEKQTSPAARTFPASAWHSRAASTLSLPLVGRVVRAEGIRARTGWGVRRCETFPTRPRSAIASARPPSPQGGGISACEATMLRRRPAQPNMSAMMPEYQPIIPGGSACAGRRLSPVLETKVSTAADLAVLGLVAAADLHGVVGLDQAPAGVGVARREGCAVGQLAARPSSPRPWPGCWPRTPTSACRRRCRRRRRRRCSRRSCDFMLAGSIGQKPRLVGEPGVARDLARHLRRDDVDQRAPCRSSRSVITVVGLRIDALDAAVHLRVLPFDHAGIVLLPAFQEQALLGEALLGIEDDDLATSCSPWP